MEKIFERFHIGSSIVLKINVKPSKSVVKCNYPTENLAWEVDDLESEVRQKRKI